MEIQKQIGNDKKNQLKIVEAKTLEETGTQTPHSLPYEYLLLGILDQKNQMNMTRKCTQQDAEFRLSPTAMLNRYVEACTRATIVSVDKMSWY